MESHFGDSNWLPITDPGGKLVGQFSRFLQNGALRSALSVRFDYALDTSPDKCMKTF